MLVHIEEGGTQSAKAQARVSEPRERTMVDCHEDTLRGQMRQLGECREDTGAPRDKRSLASGPFNSAHSQAAAVLYTQWRPLKQAEVPVVEIDVNTVYNPRGGHVSH